MKLDRDPRLPVVAAGLGYLQALSVRLTVLLRAVALQVNQCLDRTGDSMTGTLVIGNTTVSAFASATAAANDAYLLGFLRSRNPLAAAGRFWLTGSGSGGAYNVINDALVGTYVTYGGTSWSATSDERVKTDLVPLGDAVARIAGWRCVTGRYVGDAPGVSRAFLIAQDVLATLPEAVNVQEDGLLGLQYTDTLPLLVAAVKELAGRVAVLEGR